MKGISNLFVHEKRHVFACDVCNNTYSTIFVLKQHMKSVHENGRIHKCNTCERTFTSLPNLKCTSKGVMNLKEITNALFVENILKISSMWKNITALFMQR